MPPDPPRELALRRKFTRSARKFKLALEKPWKPPTPSFQSLSFHFGVPVFWVNFLLENTLLAMGVRKFPVR